MTINNMTGNKHLYIIIFTNPIILLYLLILLHEQDVTQSGVLTGLNSEFYFSWTGCHIKVKKTQPVLLFIHSWRDNSQIHTFP